MVAADAVKSAQLWGLNRVSRLRRCCFWVGECRDGREILPSYKIERRLTSDSGGLDGRLSARIRVQDGPRPSASGDTLVRSGRWIQDVSKYVPSCCRTCQASSLSITIMEPPQSGHSQVAASRVWLGAQGTEEAASFASSC